MLYSLVSLNDKRAESFVILLVKCRSNKDFKPKNKSECRKAFGIEEFSLSACLKTILRGLMMSLQSLSESIEAFRRYVTFGSKTILCKYRN